MEEDNIVTGKKETKEKMVTYKKKISTTKAAIIFKNVFNDISTFVKRNKLLSAIIAGVVLVILIVIILSVVHSSNNPLNGMVKSLSKNINSGSFEYRIEVETDKKTSMKYVGSIVFDHANQGINAVYNADYNDYKYKSVLYSKDHVSTSGNYYNGKWTVKDSSSKVRDFFDFFNDFNKGHFDGGAFISFFDITGTFSPTELGNTVDKVFGELKGQTNNILHMNITSENGVTKYTMKPELIKLFDIIIKNSGPAFMSATDYLEFTESVETNYDKLSNADCTIEYGIQSGNMVSFSISLDADGKTQTIKMDMSNFGSANIEIPRTFFEAASIDSEQE